MPRGTDNDRVMTGAVGAGQDDRLLPALTSGQAAGGRDG